MRVNSQPDVLRLCEVANFVTAKFSTKIKFLAKRGRDFTKKIAISQNRCWLKVWIWKIVSFSDFFSAKKFVFYVLFSTLTLLNIKKKIRPSVVYIIICASNFHVPFCAKLFSASSSEVLILKIFSATFRNFFTLQFSDKV